MKSTDRIIPNLSPAKDIIRSLEFFQTKILQENILPVHILDQLLEAELNLARSVLIAAKTKLALLARKFL